MQACLSNELRESIVFRGITQLSAFISKTEKISPGRSIRLVCVIDAAAKRKNAATLTDRETIKITTRLYSLQRPTPSAANVILLHGANASSMLSGSANPDTASPTSSN
jgi:hypothetical protein